MKVMGIDCSTNSLAYGIVEDDVLIEYGEYFFEGSDIYKRMLDARRKTEAVRDMFDVDFIVFEKAVMVRSVSVAIKMASVFGVVISIILENGVKVVEVEPLVWQSWIGNPVVKGAEKKQLLTAHPELKTRSQVSTFVRKYRKERTNQWVTTKYGINAANDNISDAVAIAAFGYDKLNRYVG